MSPQLQFGYPWWLTYGPLAVTAIALPLLCLGYAKGWSKLLMLPIGVATLWSLAAFTVTRFVLNPNGRLALPAQHFFSDGKGRVLDMGAGTGKSTLMVLEMRPQSTVVALDLFSDSYKQHFGPEVSGKERLLSNLKAAGVDNRAEIQVGDMRKLPFDPAMFDAIVSTYAIDHMNREGSVTALREAARVLKPGGDFLMMVLAKDFWLKFAFGPLLLHSGTRGPDWWTNRMREAGFQIVEQGTRPGTFYVLARKS